MRSLLFKAPFLKIYLLIFISTVFSAQSQTPFDNKYAGKSLTTTIEYQSNPKVIITGPNIASESVKANNFAKKDKQTWSSVISKANGQRILTRELKRIEVTAPGPSGVEKYDSANAFESTDGTEAFVTSKLKALKKKVTYTMNANEWKSQDSFVEDVNSVWTDNLPIIGQEEAIQGLLFNTVLPDKIEENISWQETIVKSDSEVHNTYTVENKKGSVLTIHLHSLQTFNDKNKINVFKYGSLKGSANQSTSNKLSSTKISKSFEGKISMDQITLLIYEMNFTVSSKTNLISGNVTTPRTQTLTMHIINQL